MIADDNLDGTFSFSIYLTQAKRLDSRVNYREYGRPNFEAEVADFSSYGSDSLVFACGPRGLIDLLADLTQKMDVDFHQEIFEF